MVVDDILAGWLARAAQGGHPNGLRGWVERYVRRVDGRGDEDEAWRRHVAALNDDKKED